MVTPLQLYFSFRSAFLNGQVSVFSIVFRISERGCYRLGAWSPPSSTLVRYPWTSSSISSSCARSVCCFMYLFSLSDAALESMRYSRMLEESSFANKRADYFWLLLQSSIMLLVKLSKFFFPDWLYSHPPCLVPVSVSALQPPLPLLPARLCSHLRLVEAPSIHAHIVVRPNNHHGALPTHRPCRVLMGPERHMESGGGRSCWVCRRAYRMVLAGCVDERDGRWHERVQ